MTVKEEKQQQQQQDPYKKEEDIVYDAVAPTTTASNEPPIPAGHARFYCEKCHTVRTKSLFHSIVATHHHLSPLTN